MTDKKSSATALQSAARTIDEISSRAMEAFGSPESFEKELAVATAVQELRAALTPDVMREVMALMNTTIGFDTDRNPAKWTKSEPCVPYTQEQVKDVFIESRMRGFHIVGREFNIIAGNFYAGVNGLERLVRKHPRVSNLRDTYEVPRLVGEKGAVVKTKAEWHQDNVPQSLEREFAVRVNLGQGADAIIGKAKRKLLAAVYSRLSGVVTPEGEVDDIPVHATVSREAAPAEALFPGAKKPAEAPAPAPVPAPAPTQQYSLARFLGEAGVSFDDFRSFCIAKNLGLKDADSLASFDEVPETFIAELRSPKQARVLNELVKKFGTAQTKK